MRIACLVKCVPNTSADFTFRADSTLDRSSLDEQLSELDEYAVEAAVRLADSGDASSVTYLTMGPGNAADGLRKALAMGGDDAVLRPALGTCKPTGVVLGPGSRIAVMPDSGGVAKALIGRLEKLGCEVLLLVPDGPLAPEGTVQGVCWLPALDDEGPIQDLDLDLARWRAGLDLRVKRLHVLMRRLYDQAPLLVTGTRLGGCHGYDEAGATAVMGGAVTGFAKAYKQELPRATVKAVDFPAGRKTSWMADTLIEETLRDPGCVEAGHADDLRWTVALTEQAPSGPGLELGADTVFAVTGAAGGIVSAIVADLARAGVGTFHLLDLAECPEEGDEDARRFGADRDALKLELAQRIRSRGERRTPVLIEAELARQERRYAARQAVQAVRGAGGTAHYHRVDLTDESAVAEVMARVRELSGHVEVLVHAAGTEISRAMNGKEPAEFDRVFDVKSDGWFNLLHGAGELPIGAAVCFSSIAGRFGNGGQADYSAADDLLCKSVSGLRRTRPQLRALAVGWTAWSQIGMASRGSVPEIMKQAGIEQLPPRAGIPWLRGELTAGGYRGEVLVAGELGVLARQLDETRGIDIARIDTAHAGPMIGSVRSFGTDGMVIRTTLDPARQPFLNDHRIDGVPVLPGVMGIEAFAEIAKLAAPGRRVADIEDVEFLAPLKFYRDEPREVTLRATVRRDGADLVAECTLEAERLLPGAAQSAQSGAAAHSNTTVHFTGNVRLRPESGRDQHEDAVSQADRVMAAGDVYRLHVHGPAYQVVASEWKQDGTTASALADRLPPDHDPAQSPTSAAPRLAELCFQTAGLVQAAEDGQLALPRHVDRVQVWTGATGPMFARVRRNGDGFDAAVLDAKGGVVVRVEGYQATPLPGTLPDDVRGSPTGLS